MSDPPEKAPPEPELFFGERPKVAKEEEPFFGEPPKVAKEPYFAPPAQTKPEDAPLAVPAGAMCAVHEGVPAIFTCTRCGCFGCEQCAFSRVPRREVCRACASKGLGTPIPWEQRGLVGAWRGFWDTTNAVCRSPSEFFRTPSIEDGLLGSVTYGVLVNTAGTTLYALTIAVVLILGSLVAAAFAGASEGGVMVGMMLCYGIALVPLSIVQGLMHAVIAILFGGSLTHLTLVMMKKANASFEQTLRAVSYANAPTFYMWIPCIGWFVAWFWMVGVEVIAIRETHRISTDRAAIAVLGYRLVFILGIIGLYVAMFTWIMSLGDRIAAPPSY